MEAIFICQFFAAIASYKRRECLRETYWRARLAEWLPELLTAFHSQAVHRFFYVGLDPFWPLQQVGWSPARFTASSRRKETFFCYSSCKIHSEDSLRSSAFCLCSALPAQPPVMELMKNGDTERIFKKERQILWLSALLLPWYVHCQNLP